MRPRPTSATNRQLVAVALFLFTGCIWWRAAPFVKEELGHARTLLGLGDKADPTFESQFDDADGAFPSGTQFTPIMPPQVAGFQGALKPQVARTASTE